MAFETGSPQMTRAVEATSQDRFTIAVWRALRDTGVPLDPSAVHRLAADAGYPEHQLAARLVSAGERDEEGRLAGLGGLSVAAHPHRLVFEEHVLSTWCAWDPFFLVPALGGNARLETADPVSGAPFTVHFVDGRAKDLPEAEAAPVLSMVDRDALRPLDVEGDGEPATGATVEDVWSSF